MERLTAISAFVILLITVCVGTNHGGDQDHPCGRECDGVVKSCEYNLTLEWSLTLSKECGDCPTNKSHCYLPGCTPADGRVRPYIAINKQMPGPLITVCEGDTIVAHVTNLLVDGGGTSMHWHGIHQYETPYMDGTSMVTQCPINLFNTFRYEFKAYPSGTHWYHSHVGFQRADGMYGPLVVRKKSEPHVQLYDEDKPEHVVLIADWLQEHGPESYVINGLSRSHHTAVWEGLINGRAQRHNVTSDGFPGLTPSAVFEVERGVRYRFRVINAASNCEYTVSVDGHNMTVISLDGRDVKPVETESFYMTDGERYDFILHANNTSGNYWFKAQGMDPNTCGSVSAILNYKGIDVQNPQEDADATPASEALQLPDERLQSLVDSNYTNEKVEFTYFTAVDMSFAPVVDNIQLTIPPVPVFSQPFDVDQSTFCNSSSFPPGQCISLNPCRCTHVVRLKYNQIVEVVIINKASRMVRDHPMHLHGYDFRVMAVEKLPPNIKGDAAVSYVKALYEARNLTKTLLNPVSKDTVNVFGPGYTVIRFRTDNPGYWFFHCHKEEHAVAGQGFLFKVGEEKDFRPVPPNFQRCGDWGTSTSPTLWQTCDAPSTTPPTKATCTSIANKQISNIVVMIVLAIIILM